MIGTLSRLARTMKALRLRLPDGEPLHALDVSADEMAALRADLAMVVRDLPDHTRDRGAFHEEACAALCFHVAEWLHEHYQSGSLGWNGPLDALGFPYSPQTLYPSVLVGLEWWGRRLMRWNDNRQFLATLYVEGGPSVEVLTHVIDGAVELVESYGDLVAEEVVADRVRRWSQRFASAPVFVAWCVGLVRQVVALRREAAQHDDPVAWLERNRPEWRKRVALRTGDARARSWLENAVRAPRHLEVQPKIETTWVGTRLDRRLVLPRRLSDDGLRALGVQEPGNFRYGWAYLATHGGRVPAARLQRAGDVVLVDRVEAPPVDSTDSVSLVVEHADGVEGCVLPGGESLDAASPWVFVEKGGQRRLVAVGAARVPTSTAYVAVPPGTHLSPAAERAGECAGRAVHRVEASTMVTVSGETFRIRTGDTSGKEWSLRGRSRQIGRSTVWLGKIVPVADGPTTGARLEWRGPNGWVPFLPDRCLGVGRLRVVDQGEVVLVTPVQVIPEDLEVRPRYEHSSYFVAGRGVAHVGATAKVGMTVTPGTSEVHLQSPDPPREVEIRVRYTGGSEGRFEVPYPRSLVGFLRPDDGVLAPDARVAHHRLWEVRAVCHRHGARALLSGRVGQGAWERLADVEDGREVRLSHVPGVQRLLSRARLDGVVDLRLEVIGSSGRGPTMRVGWYEAAFEGSGQLYALDTDEPVERVELRPIGMPDAEPLLAERVESKHWQLPEFGRGAPWLMTAWGPDRLAARPRLVGGSGPPLPPPATALERAVLEFDAAARTAAIDEALEAVVADPLHPDRARLEAHFDTLGVLPAATFDVVVRCAENPAVAVEAAIAAPNGAALGRRWRAFEELPFSWDLVPVATWVAAAKRLRDAFEGRPFDPLLAFASFLSEAGILPGTRPMWENRANLPEFARYAAACMVEAITGALPERCPLRLPRDVVEEPIRAGIVDAKGQLLIRRREDDWPDADLPPLKELERWFPEIPDRAVPHRNAALRAPLLVAGVLAGVVDRSVGQHHLYDLARLRAFDPTWYDQARDHALALLLVLPARGARR